MFSTSELQLVLDQTYSSMSHWQNHPNTLRATRTFNFLSNVVEKNQNKKMAAIRKCQLRWMLWYTRSKNMGMTRIDENGDLGKTNANTTKHVLTPIVIKSCYHQIFNFTWKCDHQNRIRKQLVNHIHIASEPPTQAFRYKQHHTDHNTRATHPTPTQDIQYTTEANANHGTWRGMWNNCSNEDHIKSVAQKPQTPHRGKNDHHKNESCDDY